MNRHSEALAAFATAVAHDSSSEQLLQTLIEAGLKSPLQGKNILKLCNVSTLLRIAMAA